MRRALPLATGILLLAAGLAALGWTGAVTTELRRLLRATGTATTVFAEVGRLQAQQTAWATLAHVLLAAGFVAVLIGIAILLLPRERIAGVDHRMLRALPPLAVGLVGAGVVGALDWGSRVSVIGPSITSAVATARQAPPTSQDTVSTAAVTAGLLVLLVWLAARAVLAPDPERWLVVIGVVVLACAGAGILVLRLRTDGYAHLGDLYAGFFTGNPDPRVAGREVLAVQARDQVLSILGGAPFAAAAAGIPLLIALRAARPRVRASDAGELVPDR